MDGYLVLGEGQDIVGFVEPKGELPLKIAVAGNLVEDGLLRPALSVGERAPEGSGRVGSLVLALGRPIVGLPMASLGVVSVAGGTWRTAGGERMDGYLRTDATFYPGFSGGPLVDVQGRLMGINSSRLARGAGLTIPAAAADRVAGLLRSHGRVRRAYLGIGSQPVRLPPALSTLAGERPTGLLVVSVEPESAAERGGILVGDILIELGRQAVSDTSDLQAALGGEVIGRDTPVTVLRGGERRELVLRPSERS